MNIFTIFSNTTYTQKANYLLLFYYTIWYALNMIFHIGDGAGRIGMILFGISLMANVFEGNLRCLIYPKAIKIWIIWVIYVSAFWLTTGLNSTILNDHPLSRIVIIYSQIFIPCYIMSVSYFETCRDNNKFTLWMLALFIAYSLLGVLFGRNEVDFDGMRATTVLGNGMPILCVSTIFLAFYRRMKRWLSAPTFIIIVIFSLFCIISAATRKAFGGAMIIVLFGVMGLHELYKGQKIVFLILACLLGYFCVDAILEFTVLGERLAGTQEQGAMYNETNIKWLNFLGDRAIQYIIGFELFMEAPITGIGITNYRLVANSHLPIHSEYIVQLCECGLIGLTLFVSFYYALFKSIYRFGHINREFKRYRMLFCGYMFMMLFLNLTAWTYTLATNFVCFGIILACCTVSKSYA